MRLIAKLAALAGLVACAIAGPTAALAQSRVMEIDTGRVYTETAAGRDMGAKLLQLREQLLQEIRVGQAEVTAQAEQLRIASEGLTAEEVRASPTLARQRVALEASRARQEQLDVATERDFWTAAGDAKDEYEQQLAAVISEVMNTRQAQEWRARPPSQPVVPETDGTAEVIALADQRFTTINVTRPTTSH